MAFSIKKKLLTALLACLLVLSACQYIVVEDDEETQVMGLAAHAETSPETAKPAALARGSRDDENTHAVADLQRRLIGLGYLQGEADGIFGGGTEAALSEFQRLNGLEPTGALDEATRALLDSAQAMPMPTPEPTPLAAGAKGEGVKAVQEQLKVYGFLSGVADGDFGANTDMAVRAFQQYQYDMGRIDLPPAPAPEPTPAPDSLLVEELLPQRDAPDATDGEDLPELAAPTYAPDGILTDEQLTMLTDGSFPIFCEEVGKGSKGWEVLRVQYRLADLDYQWDNVDGLFGPNTEEALRYFQKRNKLEESGVADEQTQRALFSVAAVRSDKPRNMYLLKVSVSDQRVYAYKWVNGGYNQLARTMVCSTGTSAHPTPYGTFNAGGPAGRWYYFKKYNCWAQYAYQIDGGILFHSVIYGQKDTSTLRRSSVNNLGSRASHGCVRLSVDDAKWIYNNCPAGTLVKVY